MYNPVRSTLSKSTTKNNSIFNPRKRTPSLPTSRRAKCSLMQGLKYLSAPRGMGRPCPVHYAPFLWQGGNEGAIHQTSRPVSLSVKAKSCRTPIDY
ncbi:hypothetical protein CDAR_473201 [Caerostris darwini]|uniref:Uncharacterized protein n=1 Tax=Caerostris darwini TaxID=1538125 RepID=A0AAV4PK43_9ARAC|nr:hypothetical protein CDAR_473081 [Caerostris darwini]GIX97395.1 hypothetical protein CDAR_473201 [Caerostris darwini]